MLTPVVEKKRHYNYFPQEIIYFTMCSHCQKLLSLKAFLGSYGMQVYMYTVDMVTLKFYPLTYKDSKLNSVKIL